MSAGDRMKMGDTTGVKLGCGHAHYKPGETCLLCGDTVPKENKDCKHGGQTPGQVCKLCNQSVPCPQCHAAGNIVQNGDRIVCQNCSWSNEDPRYIKK
jgi:hypothetical protein